MKEIEKKVIIAAFIFGGIAIILAVVSAILVLFYSGIIAVIGLTSTVMSIILGVVAMVYTYLSGRKTFVLWKKTMDTLDKVEAQNRKLIDKINLELLEGAYDSSGLEDALINNSYNKADNTI